MTQTESTHKQQSSSVSITKGININSTELGLDKSQIYTSHINVLKVSFKYNLSFFFSTKFEIITNLNNEIYLFNTNPIYKLNKENKF